MNRDLESRHIETPLANIPTSLHPDHCRSMNPILGGWQTHKAWDETVTGVCDFVAWIVSQLAAGGVRWNYPDEHPDWSLVCSVVAVGYENKRDYSSTLSLIWTVRL